jgi:hypothetical protein
VLVTTIARIPASGVRAYALYEDLALSLLPDHGATLERRMRDAAGTIEIHVVRFPDRAAYDRYMDDPRRKSRRELLVASKASVEVIEDLEDTGE